MNNDLIYLASPYTHTDPEIVEQRYRRALWVSARLMSIEYLVYSPIVHLHFLAVLECLPGTWEYWERFDRAMISRCQQLWILALSGWEESKGVAAEIEIARQLGIPVRLLHFNEDGSFTLVEM